jgi:hypothetical protein
MHNSLDCFLLHLQSETHFSLYTFKQNMYYYFKSFLLYEHKYSLRSRKRNLISCGGGSNQRPWRIILKGIKWK